MVLVMGIFGLIPHFANHCTGMAANSANQSLCVNKLQISKILIFVKFQFQSWVLSARPNWNNGTEGLISTWPTTPKLAHVPSQRRLPWLHAHEHNGEFPIPVSTSIPLGISRPKSESHCKAPRWNARNAIRKPFFLLLETSFLLFGCLALMAFSSASSSLCASLFSSWMMMISMGSGRCCRSENEKERETEGWDWTNTK